MLIYDCEILKAIQGKKEERLEGIEYCSGWRDFEGMGISCIGAYDCREQRYRIFLKDNFQDFQKLLDSRSLLVGFNSLAFDNPLITSNGFTIPDSLQQYDILVEVWRAHGLSPEFKYPSHVGFGLDDCCRVNFNTGKSGHGALAPVQWQRGEFGSVIDYCLNDVDLTSKLFIFILNSPGEFKSPKTGEKIEIRMPWKRD
jgi:hypothetical protein